jgi:anhydro-N-acetylmuramic acid kinase
MVGRALHPIKRLFEKAALEKRLVAGMISGTSADGVDVVFVELEGHGKGIRHRILGGSVIPYSRDLRERILRSYEAGSIHDVCMLNFLIAKFISRAFKDAIETSGLGGSDVDLIGSHGQTIYHYPELVSCGGIETRCSLQLGSVQVIAEETGVITIGNFRARDIAAGGLGAPIIAYTDYALLSHPRIARAIQNIGGIANVTILPPDPRVDDVIAFDTGPGNSLIDFSVSILYPGMDHDPGGEIAAKGSPDEEILSELMAHPFIAKPPPKTTGREVFGKSMAEQIIERSQRKGLSKEDIVATLTMFTAKSIAANYRLHVLPRMKIEEIVIGGGGVKNKTLMKMLEKELSPMSIRILRHEDLGIDSKVKEALGMAILAHETLSGIPNNVPGATGAFKRVVMGEIAL